MPYNISTIANEVRRKILDQIFDKLITSEEHVDEFLNGVELHLPPELEGTSCWIKAEARQDQKPDEPREWVVRASDPNGRIHTKLILKWEDRLLWMERPKNEDWAALYVDPNKQKNINQSFDLEC